VLFNNIKKMRTASEGYSLGTIVTFFKPMMLLSTEYNKLIKKIVYFQWKTRSSNNEEHPVAAERLHPLFSGMAEGGRRCPPGRKKRHRKWQHTILTRDSSVGVVTDCRAAIRFLAEMKDFFPLFHSF
jgi:hypothetical protein